MIYTGADLGADQISIAALMEQQKRLAAQAAGAVDWFGPWGMAAIGAAALLAAFLIFRRKKSRG